jgi:hypothetical protein
MTQRSRDRLRIVPSERAEREPHRTLTIATSNGRRVSLPAPAAASAREGRAAALLGELAHGELRQVDLPLDARPAVVVPARDAEGVLGPVGKRAHHEQREEAVALEHLAEVELAALAERVRPGVERLLSAGREQLVDLPAALGELTVGENALLAHLHAANAALEPRGARDDVCHALPPRGQSRRGGAWGTAA